MIVCRQTDPLVLSDLDAYQSWLVPSALIYLDQARETNSYFLGFEAYLNEKWVGFALVEVHSAVLTAELLSIQVAESYRRQGIGTALFLFLQQNLVEKECQAIAFQYEQNIPFATALERILQQAGWASPKIYLIRCYYDDVSHFHPSWIDLPPRLPPETEIFLWKNLLPEERSQILFSYEQGRFLPYLLPFRREDQIELLNSLGIRYQGKVIGWNITHRFDPDTIVYSILYINKDYQYLGYAIFLLMQSMHMHKSSSVKKAIFEINLEEIDPSWWRFVKRRLIPYADRVEKFKWAYRAFV